jgi:hypothetical protein
MATGTNMADDKRHAAATRGDWAEFFKGYKLDDALASLSLAKRTAHLLDWAARKGPGTLIPYNVILKGIMGYAHTPRIGNEEVDRFRHGPLGGARKYLQQQYKRDLKNAGVGARATVDGLDVVKSVLPANVRRVNSAHAALGRAAKLVDPARLPAAGPDRAWVEWYARTVSPALKALAADDRIAKLLPPAPDKAASPPAAKAADKPEPGK